MSDAITMIEWISSRVVPQNKAAKMTPEELEGKIITGLFYHNPERAEYTDEYAKLIERVQAKMAKQVEVHS
jgi:2-oxoglutarate ferredoxin oxidoreductase subunit beta